MLFVCLYTNTYHVIVAVSYANNLELGVINFNPSSYPIWVFFSPLEHGCLVFPLFVYKCHLATPWLARIYVSRISVKVFIASKTIGTLLKPCAAAADFS